MALHRVAVELRADVPRAHRPARRRPASSTFAPRSRSSRRTPCGPPARRWAPPPSCPTTCGSSTRRSAASTARAAARPPAPPRPTAPPTPCSPSTPARASCRLPAAGHPSDRVGDLVARLVARGFARIKVGDDVVSLSPAPSLDLAGREAIEVVLDRLVLAPRDAVAPGRVPRAGVSRGRRPGDRRAPAGRPPAEIRRYGEQFGCQTLRHPARAPAAAPLLLQSPARSLPGVQGVREPPPLRRGAGGSRPRHLASPTARWSPGGIPSASGTRSSSSGSARRRKVDVTGPTRSCPTAVRRWVYEGDEDFCGIRGFFEEVEGYRYKLHVRVFLSRYRSQTPVPGLPGHPAQAGGARGHGGRRSIAEVAHLDHRRSRGRGSRRSRSPRGRPRSGATSWTVSPRRCRSSAAWASATSRSTARCGRSPAARRSASRSPPSSARSWSAPSTSWTSPPSGSTRAT